MLSGVLEKTFQGGTATYVNSRTCRINLRTATYDHPALEIVEKKMIQLFFFIGGEFPSLYNFASTRHLTHRSSRRGRTMARKRPRTELQVNLLAA
jgi:hypothetical protein